MFKSNMNETRIGPTGHQTLDDRTDFNLLFEIHWGKGVQNIDPVGLLLTEYFLGMDPITHNFKPSDHLLWCSRKCLGTLCLLFLSSTNW